MSKAIFSVTLGLLLLAGCSREDDARARAKLEHAKEELKRDANQAGRKIEDASHRAATEARHDLHEASREMKKATQ